MAVHENNNLPNGHATFLGTSGSGKTTLIKQLPQYKKADILIAYDPLCEHDVTHFKDDYEGFYHALVNGFRSGQKTRIGYAPPDLPPRGLTPQQEQAWRVAQVEQVSKLVWLVSDGRLPSLYLIEEAGDAINNAGGISGFTGSIMRKSRKFGVSAWFSAQRSQNIPKDVTGNCSNKFFMYQDEIIDAKKSAEFVGCDKADILSLEAGEYYHVQKGHQTEKKRTTKP